MHFYLLILFLINFLKIISVDSKPFVMANADEYPQYRDYLRKKFGTNPSKFGPPDDELPEYKEYLKNLEANNSPIFEQNDQVFEFEQLGNKLNLPLPCTEIKDDSGGIVSFMGNDYFVRINLSTSITYYIESRNSYTSGSKIR
ncbi:hypothetical protein Mgra_00001010 [Meloidogyne graminicola]|uniref:Uncharacterized protein n=1 Tax=Meloidogyne graminicola TaxID=189291 RepID=A0A8T0A307_9BILA|nr:hypothetical protein Mgra_00001010 [Meloidogyne graminicola]